MGMLEYVASGVAFALTVLACIVLFRIPSPRHAPKPSEYKSVNVRELRGQVAKRQEAHPAEVALTR
jgi:hypothetical protein